MRLIYFIVFLVLESFALSGQPYVNRAIDYPAGSFINYGLYQLKNKYAIPLLGENYNSGVLITDLIKDTFLFLPKFTFALKPGVVTFDTLRLLGKYYFSMNGIKVLQIDQSGNISDSSFIHVPDSIEYAPYSVVAIFNSFYLGYMKLEVSRKKMGILKHTKVNDDVIIDDLDPICISRYLSDLISTSDNNLLTSYHVYYSGRPDWDGFVMKLDTFGQVIFKSDTLIRTNIIYPWKYIAELSNKEYLICYHQDMHGVAGWHDYYPYMPTYTWLDSVGKISRQIIPRIRRPAQVVSSGILAGKGDYFFSYGSVTLLGRDDYYGYITKYSNAGDTIWSHLYRHPDFQTGRYSHEINHLIEDENGDLVGTGRIAEPNTAGKIWLLRVNANGCFGDDNCTELTLSEHRGREQILSRVLVFPNPTNDEFGLISSKNIRAIRIINSIGMNEQFSANINYIKVQLSGSKPGVYFITVFYDDGTSEICKIAKN